MPASTNIQGRQIRGGDLEPVVVVRGLEPIPVTMATSVITTPVEYAITLTLANTQYAQALPANTRFFEFQCRTAFDVRWAFVTGRVAGSVDPYRTVKSGAYYFSPTLDQGASPSTLYFASAQAGVVVELLVWT